MLPASLSARWLPRDFVESSSTGGAITLVAYALMLVLFTCELQSYLSRAPSSSLLIDQDVSPLLQINFDIDMHDIECRNLDVVVIDELGREGIRSMEKNYELTDLDKAGRLGGIHSRRDSKYADDAEQDEELEHKRLVDQLQVADGKDELDSDWADSHDGFKHNSFQHVIQFHDFTVINFFAGWCIHCQQFAPMWNDIANDINMATYVNADGKNRNVQPMKLNCVDFKAVCREQGIDAFPTIRLYKSDGTMSRFDGIRNAASIERWVKDIVSAEHHAHLWNRHHEESERGCNLQGYMRVPRVPGHLEIFAGGGDQNLEPAMTNVSHLVKHLSFSEPAPGRRLPSRLALQARGDLPALDGQQFSTSAFHEGVEHHLKVVRTVTPIDRTYLFSHYSRTQKQTEAAVPQARFYYDLEPFAIEVIYEQKPWYDFSTSLLALLGGIFVIMRMISMASLSAVTALMPRSAKSNGIITG